MRTPQKVLLSFAALAGAGLGAGRAFAQVDINPPLPNVLLLIDTSGSMENMIDGQRPEDASAACDPGTSTPMNRWATLVSTLTGTIEDFSCQTVDRGSTAFINEYTFDGAAPYDAEYYLPFHRLLSNGCTAGPGTYSGTWFPWPADPFHWHDFSGTGTACSAPGWQQTNDGVLDVFMDRARFGLMTFDSLPNSGTGATGSAPTGPSGMAGMWSYFPGWDSGSVCARGNPASCAEHDFEVGARNPAAPPWEGRLIPFGLYNATLTDVQATNNHLQDSLVAMRPYGATPLAGMMQDASDFLLSEDLTNPSNPTQKYGPTADKYYVGGCRKTFIIVLSDGEPNLDLRPECTQSGTPNGKCPYPRQPWDVASDLATYGLPGQHVTTFAVGFGLSTVGADDCSALTPADVSGNKCATATGALAACCTLAHIAIAGGSSKAYFADNASALKSALSQVLAQIAAGSTSRTIPVFASASVSAGNGVTTQAPAAAYQFASSFESHPTGGLWTGNLERKRYVCKLDANNIRTAQIEDVDPSKGDDFEANLNAADGVHPRKLFTAVADTVGGTDIFSKRSIRPGVTSDDGVGVYTTQSSSANAPELATSFTTDVPNEALGIPDAGVPAACSATLASGTGATCSEKLLRWNVGLSNAGLTPTRAGNALGSIYHSTPAAVSTPRAFLRDESYSNFAVAKSKRPVMLYTATTDGQLHAFKVTTNDPVDTFKVDTKENNELWSFMPPHVLPRLLGGYDQQSLLLDGAPIVKDVVFTRTQTQAIAGGGVGSAAWATVLLAGGAAGGGFYYALDVTDPTAPTFLWQLSTDQNDVSLFGTTTPTPAIGTVALDAGGGAVKEVAIAVLSGGSAPLSTGTCARSGDYTGFPGAAPRTSVRCWSGPSSARSVTIVELQTGKVLRSFRHDVADGPGSLAYLPATDFDSPITGVPVLYPSQPGQVADRAYVGDADGGLWRIDLSSTDPTAWTASLAWDAYTGEADNAGQPIQTPAVVSVDALGNTVVLFATGDQEMLTPQTQKNFVWSLTETRSGGVVTPTANWHLELDDGKRVTGPIALFDSIAYFSTYTPLANPSNICQEGYGSVWGVHYANNCAKLPSTCAPGDANSADLPWPQLAKDPNDLTQGYDREQAQAAGTVVYGVAVTQTPSCYDTTDYSDDYLGDRTSVSNVTSGRFQLVFQTGQGGTKSNNSKTSTTTVNLPSPRQTTRIDSWASVVE